MGFLWFGRGREEKGGEKEEVVKVEYTPTGLTMPQKATLIGGSFMGILGVSYMLDYVLYLTFGSVCAGVMFYDNEKVVRFINERAFLSQDLIGQMNGYTSWLAGYLTPAQVTDSVGRGASAVSQLSWLTRLGLSSEGSKLEDKQTKIIANRSKLDQDIFSNVGPNGKKLR